MLVRELGKNFIPHRFVEYTGVDHGVGLGKGLVCENWFEEAVAFWESQRRGREQHEGASLENERQRTAHQGRHASQP